MSAGVSRATVVALVVLCSYMGRAHAGGVTGIVVDGADFKPIAGAKVSIPEQNLDTVTDKTGNFRFDSVTPGKIEFRILVDGYEPSDQQFKVSQRGLKELVLVVMKTGTASEIIDISESGPPPPKVQGKQELGRKELTRIPGSRGDALTAVKNLPGIANANAPGSGPGLLVIRGSAPEDSKVLLDGIQVPLLYHFFGL